MATALKPKGYAYHYAFAEAAGHTDGRVTRQNPAWRAGMVVAGIHDSAQGCLFIDSRGADSLASGA